MKPPSSNNFRPYQAWILKLTAEQNLDLSPCEVLGEADDQRWGYLQPGDGPILDLSRGCNEHYCAVKHIRPRGMRTYEISILKAIDHPHICNLEVLSTRGGSLNLVMPYMEYGSTLNERVVSNASFSLSFAAAASPLYSEVFARSIMFQICTAIKHIHSQWLTHRDNKPENILIPAGVESRRFWPSHTRGQPYLTLWLRAHLYMAPEVPDGNPHPAIHNGAKRGPQT